MRRGRARGGVKNEAETEPSRILQLKKCCDMLLAGGYHRARVQTLSPFDKVVGGMVWSITGSGVSVNVDIIFQENSTIGERIKLSENVVEALLQMRCPHRIEPNQIQGLDYPMLFPCVQWLVRKVIETRRLTGDLVRQLSVAQFGKNFHFAEDERPAAATAFVGAVAAHYAPRRAFRRGADMTAGGDGDTVAARTDATLLEFGERLYLHNVDDDMDDDNARRGGQGEAAKAKAAERKKREEEARLAAAKRDEERLSAMQHALSAVGQDGKLKMSKVGNIVGTQADLIAESAAEYEAEMARIAAADPGGLKAAQAQHDRQVDALRRQLAAAEERLAGRRGEFDALQEKTDALRATLEERQQYVDRIIDETAKLDELEANHENQSVLAALKAAVQANERVRRQEQQFKQTCKEQLRSLTAEVARCEASAGGDDDDDSEEVRRMREIEAIYDKDLAKLQKMRRVLAKRNQHIAALRRQIDDIPTRAELLQYERRFVELYELVAEKLVETRKYYDMYNTLEESHRYMLNEVKLLESICSSFPQAMAGSKAAKEEFLTKFGGIVKNVDSTKQQVTDSFNAEDATRTMLTDKHNKLLDKQRKYFKAVKDFQEECYKNEQLQKVADRQ